MAVARSDVLDQNRSFLLDEAWGRKDRNQTATTLGLVEEVDGIVDSLRKED